MENEKLFKFMEKMYTEMQEGFKDVNNRLGNVENNLQELKVDVKELKSGQNMIQKFIMNSDDTFKKAEVSFEFIEKIKKAAKQ